MSVKGRVVEDNHSDGMAFAPEVLVILFDGFADFAQPSGRYYKNKVFFLPATLSNQYCNRPLISEVIWENLKKL